MFSVMKLAGVGYLLYLAWGMWRSTGTLAFAPTGRRSDHAIAVRGAVVNLLNPKLTIFFFAFLPQFIDATAPTLVQLGVLGVVFMAVTLAMFLVYGVLAGTVRERVVGSPSAVRRLQRSFAVLFAGLGVRLAVQDR